MKSFTKGLRDFYRFFFTGADRIKDHIYEGGDLYVLGATAATASIAVGIIGMSLMLVVLFVH